MMKQAYLRILAIFVLTALFFTLGSSSVAASEGQVLGMHIMNIDELDPVNRFFADLSKPDQEKTEWRYVTVPLTLDDLDKSTEWQRFFDRAKQDNIQPIVRLATRAEGANWKVPNRKELVEMVNFLHKLQWPTDQKIIIVFNEVNHAREWGGTIDPVSYLDVLQFTSGWAHATDPSFVVLPAAMDLAAPQGTQTWEAFTYWNRLHELDSEVFSYMDAWNSHSYPNPGFSGSPTATAKNSIRGFQHELAFVKEKSGRDLQVYITETGWAANKSTLPWLESYYTYALQHVWSDPRVVAVTPFVLKGDPGPFSSFGFLDRNDQPTPHYTAISRAAQKIDDGS
jgi:hypothetical protein